MALNQFQLDELRLKAERERVNALGGLALSDLQKDNEQIARSLMPDTAQIPEYKFKPNIYQPDTERSSQETLNMKAGATGYILGPDGKKIFVSPEGTTTNFPTSRDIQTPIRTGQNVAYIPDGSSEPGGRKLFVAPDGTMADFPTDKDISQHAVKVPAPTTTDLTDNIKRNTVSATARAPVSFQDMKGAIERMKFEAASPFTDFATTRIGEGGKKIKLNKTERDALKAEIISSYDVAPKLDILAGEASPDTKTLLNSPTGATYVDKLIRAKYEFDTNVVPKLATAKSIDDVNKLISGMKTYDPKLSSQFKVMAERGLASANPEMYADMVGSKELKKANVDTKASYGDARGQGEDGYPVNGTNAQKAAFVDNNQNLKIGFAEEMLGVKAVRGVDGKIMAIYQSSGPSDSQLTQEGRDRVVGKDANGVEQTAGIVEATLKAQIASYKAPDKNGKVSQEHLALVPALEAQLKNLYATDVARLREAKSAASFATARSLADSIQDNTHKDKQALATKELLANTETKERPYIHTGAVLEQEAGRDILPEGAIVEDVGEDEVLLENVEIKTLAPEIASEIAARIESDPTKIDSVLSDSTKAVLSRYKEAVKVLGDNADDYVDELTKAAKEAFKERADKVFENVDARRASKKRVELDAFVVGAPIKPSEVSMRFEAVKGKMLSNDQQFILDNNIGGDTQALDTPEDYVMADIAMNFPGIKDLAKEILKGNTSIAGVQRVKDVIMANREMFNTQLYADTAAKTSEAVKDEQKWTKTELPKMMEQNGTAVGYLASKGFSPRDISLMRVEAGGSAFFSDNADVLKAMQTLVQNDDSPNKTTSRDALALLGTDPKTGLAGGSVEDGVIGRLPYIASANAPQIYGPASPAYGGYQLAYTIGKETMKSLSDSQISAANAAADKSQSKAFVPTFPPSLKDYFEDPNNLAVKNLWIEASKKGNAGIPMANFASLMAVQGNVNQAFLDARQINTQYAVSQEDDLRDAVSKTFADRFGFDGSSIVGSEFARGTGTAQKIRLAILAALNPDSTSHDKFNEGEIAALRMSADGVLSAWDKQKVLHDQLAAKGINVPLAESDMVKFALELRDSLPKPEAGGSGAVETLITPAVQTMIRASQGERATEA